MKKNQCVSASIVSLILTLILANSGFPQNADLGRIQLSLPTPNPVQAGQKVVFQIVAVNTGTVDWEPQKYYIQAEIFNKDKKYITKSEQLYGNAKTSVGQTALIYLSYDVPSGYVGKYYYRIDIFHNNELIITSDYYDFDVLRTTTEESTSKIRLRGNLGLGHQNSTRSGGLSNLNLDLISDLSGESLTANAYLEHTAQDKFVFDRVLLSYYSPAVTASLGDIMPDLAGLVLSDNLIRGGSVDLIMGRSMNLTLLGARTVAPKEGTETTVGTYARYAAGGRAGMNVETNIQSSVTDINLQWDAGFSYLYSFDAKNSLNTPGPTLTPADNTVMAVDGLMTWPEIAKISGEYAWSTYMADNINISPSITGKAYQTRGNFTFGPLLLSGGFSSIAPDFYSLASPASGRDKLSVDAGAVYNFPFGAGLQIGYNTYHNNLDNEPDKLTTTNETYSGGTNLRFAGLPALFLGANYNTMKDKAGDIVNNKTLTYTGGLSYVYDFFNTSANYQISNFRDKTSRAHDMFMDTASLSFVLLFARITFSTSGSLSRIKDLATFNRLQSNSASFGTNYQLIPAELDTTAWFSWTNRKDDAGTTSNTTLNGRLELKYLLFSNTTVTGGYTRVEYKDSAASANSYSDNIGTARVNITF